MTPFKRSYDVVLQRNVLSPGHAAVSKWQVTEAAGYQVLGTYQVHSSYRELKGKGMANVLFSQMFVAKLAFESESGQKPRPSVVSGINSCY